jgi:hypothetical protein
LRVDLRGAVAAARPSGPGKTLQATLQTEGGFFLRGSPSDQFIAGVP